MEENGTLSGWKGKERKEREVFQVSDGGQWTFEARFNGWPRIMVQTDFWHQSSFSQSHQSFLSNSGGVIVLCLTPHTFNTQPNLLPYFSHSFSAILIGRPFSHGLLSISWKKVVRVVHSFQSSLSNENTMREVTVTLSCARSIPKNLGIGIDWESIQNRFFIVKNWFFLTIYWPKMAKKNRFSIPRSRPSPNISSRDLCVAVAPPLMSN